MDSKITFLKELCFDSIVKNFPRHTRAFATTDDENLKRNLNFLQRVYTDQLLEHFSVSNDLYASMQKEVFDFLFNDNLKRLVIKRFLFNNFDKGTILEKAISIAPGLETVIFEQTIDECEEFMYVSNELFYHATNLVLIDIPHICNDEIIKAIAQSCIRLKSLNIRYSTVTGEGMKTLCINPDGKIRASSTLQTLNVRNIPLEIQDVAFLVHNIPTLEEVEYSNMPAVIEYLYSSYEKDKIVKYNLLTLDFTMTGSPSKLSDYLIACAEKCPKVKQIKINVFEAEHLELVSPFLKLEHLEVGVPLYLDNKTDLGLYSLLPCLGSGLKHLSICRFSLSVSILIEMCPNLETLVLSNVCYNAIGKDSHKSLQQLRTLNVVSVFFQNINSADSVMKILNSAPRLENLTLHHCDFKESDIASKLLDFSSKCILKNLQVEYTEIGVNFFEQFILNCSSLKSLTLNYCRYLYREDISFLRKVAKVSKKEFEIFVMFLDTSDEESDSDSSFNWLCYSSDDSRLYFCDSDNDYFDHFLSSISEFDNSY